MIGSVQLLSFVSRRGKRRLYVSAIALLAALAAAPAGNAAAALQPSLIDGPTWVAKQFSGAPYGFSAPLGAVFDGTHIWTANQGGNSMTETNAIDGAFVRTISGPEYAFNHPWSLAYDGAHVWVTNPNGNTVTEINANDGSLVRVLSGASYGFNAPRGIAYDPATARTWITNELGNSLTEVKVSDGSPVQILSGGSYGFSRPNTIMTEGAHLWVTNIAGNSVTELNARDGSWIRTLAGGSYGIASPAGLAYDGSNIWISNWSLGSPSVTEANASDGSWIRTIPMSAPRPVGIVALDGNIWVNLWEGSEVVEIRQSDGSIIHTFSATDGGFSFPNGIVSDGNHLWIVNAGNSSLTEFLDAGPQRPTVLDQRDDGPDGTYKEGVSASVATNGSPTTYRAEWGLSEGTYDHVGPTLPAGGTLRESGPVRVSMQLTGLPFFTTVHWRVVATNANGTRYGVDQTTFWLSHPHTVSECVKHLQWQLITADIVGPGCWVLHRVRPWFGRAKLTPLPKPYAPTNSCLYASCPPPPPPPPTPTLYQPAARLASWPDPSKPFMVAIPETSGQKVAVEINGTIVTSNYVVADQPHGFVMADDASVDLAPSADGSVPATPLARHATISTRIPISYVGPGGGPSLLARRAHAAQASGTAPSCEDPAVSGAPLLGSFPDPAGLGSSLGDLDLGGPISVHLINGQVIVCADITLPTTPCLDSGSTGVQATLIADQGGLRLQDLNAHLGCAIIAGVVFQDVSFNFSATDKRWKAGGTVEAIPGLPLHGEIEFAHGDFAHAGAATRPVYLPLGLLRLKEVGFDVYPDRTTGTVRFGSIVTVPFVDADPLAIDAGYTLQWAANPPFFEATGKVAIFGAPVFGGDVKVFGDGTVSGTAQLRADFLGLLRVEATVTADFWRVSPLRFNVDGNGSVSIPRLDLSASGEVNVSDNGAGACVDTFIGHIGIVIHRSGSFDLFGSSCDITGARDIRPRSAPRARGAQAPAVASLQFQVTAPTRGLLVGVSGLRGAPSLALAGPHGEHQEAAASGAIDSPRRLVFHDTRSGVTYVGLRSPSAGTWRVTALPGSTLLTDVRIAAVRPPVAVVAHVVRKGTSYRLVYTGPRVPGQTVQFLERGTGDVALIGTAKGGGRGAIAFSPHSGSGAPRTIVAIVKQDGLIRTERQIGTYRTPAPRRPATPRGVVARRHGSQLIATWRRSRAQRGT